MVLLNNLTAYKVIDQAISMGADFCDIFVEEKNNLSLSLSSSEIQSINSGLTFGVGIRVIYGINSLYAYSNTTDENALINMVKNLCAMKNIGRNVELNFEQFKQQALVSPISAYLDEPVELSEKIKKMMELNSLCRKNQNLVEQVNVGLLQQNQQVEIFNSEGLWVTDTRPYIRFSGSVMMKDGQKQSSAFQGPGARGGWEFMNQFNIAEMAQTLLDRAKTTLYADHCPAGVFPVVIDEGFGGVIFHEACGHLLETTSVEKKSSVFWDKKDQMIAHSAVSAVDDGTIDKAWGSISIDDEGMPAQKTQLIKDGVLTNFLCDKMGEIRTGHPRTGSARRESYRFHPASRMRNTYIEAGPYKKEQLIESMENGIYAKAMGGGSVNPGTGEFNFSVQEAYMVENGKITKPVKGATLIGTGVDVLKQISMVANNLSLSEGMCGSVSGSVPVTVGQPALKVDKILVGGQG
jgi:TldD protein